VLVIWKKRKKLKTIEFYWLKGPEKRIKKAEAKDFKSIAELSL
jgi:hypothetical protein